MDQLPVQLVSSERFHLSTLLTAVCLGAFMLLVQAGLVPVALAGIAVDLGESFTSMQWVLDGYALALATSLVTGRRLHGVSPRVTIGGGLLLIAAGVLARSVVDAGSTWSTVLFGLVWTGAGVGLLGPALTSAAVAGLPARETTAVR